jgi:hypothetical protein
MSRRFRITLVAAAVSAALMTTLTAHAQSEASELSALSLLPAAVSVAAPSMLIAGGAVLTVVSVQASAAGTVWVLERASDGARATLHFSGHLVQGALLSAGTAVAVTALASGYVLSAAGQAIAFIPNELGRALIYNERITR